MNTLLYKYLSHFIRKGWCFSCVRGELETETDCHILTPSSSDNSSTSFAFWLGCSTVGPEGPSPLSVAVLTPASYLQLEVQLELQLTQAVYGTWLYNCLMPTCFLWAYTSAPNSTTSTGQGDIPTSSTGCICFFCLFTQVHLLIDGSVKGRYATITVFLLLVWLLHQVWKTWYAEIFTHSLMEKRERSMPFPKGKWKANNFIELSSMNPFPMTIVQSVPCLYKCMYGLVWFYGTSTMAGYFMPNPFLYI